MPDPTSDGMVTSPVSDLASRVIATSRDAVVVADPEGRIIFWNPGAVATFGYPPEDAIGQTLDLIIPERLRSRHWDGYSATMTTGVTRYADDVLAVPAIRRDGSRISIEFRVSLLLGGDGRPEAIAAVIRDVTRRWQAEQELRKELADLRAQVQGSADPGDAAGG
jgi:PAS domain S-box-containing protein